jgi:outer membrane lipoprotein
MSYRALAPILAGLLLSACAGIPQAIRNAPPGDLQLESVRQQPDGHLGDRVRWGGQIVSVENGERETWVVMVARPLGFSGRPEDTDRSPGRFMARFDGFLDPATYKAGRELTVSGRLEAPQTRSVGAYPYRYPVLRVEESQLWKPLPKYPAGYWRYPYYDPWYDSWRHPYWW